jgi:diaminohydroxyphosphoribosylaminopyrimidine deaminase/5-amino-6-(5-phosphoribosylamino)uracil reductase
MPTDAHFLNHAHRIAARGLGRTWPNPSVGCILVKNNEVIAVARTADGGRPHAETQALALAGECARGATAYVTLEPCAHHGLTPPCAQALIDAGIARVVYACDDPDPRVAGRGAAMLRAAGIVVENKKMPTTARGFFRRVNHGLPYVAMKLATSLDGMLTDADGKSQWITGAQARAHGNALRAQFDAIVTGIGTVLADDPQLTARVVGNDRLVRVICDRQLRLPLESKLVRSAHQQPVWLLTTAEAVEQNASHATDLREAGVKFLVTEDAQLAPLTILKILGAEGITRALIEAGAALSTSFLAAQCVDALHWYRALILLGRGGQPAVGALSQLLADATCATQTATIALGADACALYELPSCLPD